MSLEQLYSRAAKSLESQGDYSLSAYSSTDLDRVQFDSYPPSTMFGDTSTFSGVLNILRPQFALEASSPCIRAAIDSRPWPEDEVYLNDGFLGPVPGRIRVVENASQLAPTPDIYLLAWAAFVRADMSLVLWGDNDQLLLSDWTDIIYRIQNQFSVVTDPTLMTGLSEHQTEEHRSLPPLDDFSMLSMLVGSTASSPIPETIQASSETYLHPYWSSESLDLASLRLVLHTPNNPSPSSDNASSSIGDSPLTANLERISPYPTHLVGLSPSEDSFALSSSDFTAFISEEEGSPVLSNNSGSTILHQPPGPVLAPSATGSSSFRRHSVGEASAPAVRAIGQKTKRGISEEDVVYSGFPSITVEGDNRRIASGIRASKRSRSSAVETATASSAPALLSIPLPNVEKAQDDSESSGSVDGDSSSRLLADLPPPAPSPSSSSIPSPSPSPSPAPAASPSGGQRRTRRRGGGSSARPKRTPCEYCNRTFSRIQDAQRHIATSCNASPKKTGVVCPECSQVLSRTDAAQRHWRQHENPTCATPEWAMRA